MGKVKINEKRVKYIEIKAWLTFWAVMTAKIAMFIYGYVLLFSVCRNLVIVILPVMFSLIIGLEVVKNLKEKRNATSGLIELWLKKINKEEDNMLLWMAALEFSRLSGLKKPNIFISSVQDGEACLVDYKKNKEFSVSFLDLTLEKLTFYEIVGIIAHEAAHMLNGSFFRHYMHAFCGASLMVASLLWCPLFLFFALTKTASYWIFLFALIFTTIHYVNTSHHILYNLFNRKFELACDAYAAKILRTPDPMIEFFIKRIARCGRSHGTKLAFNFNLEILFCHPSPKKRIKSLKSLLL